MIPATNQYGVATRSPASTSWVVPNRVPTPIASALSHKRLAVMIFLGVTMLGLVTALLYGRDFVAEATIRVSPVVPTSVDGADPRFNSDEQYRDFVQEQVFEIDSYATVSAALDSLGQKRWLWQEPGETDRRAAERLAARLKVEAIPDSYLVRVSLSGGDPEGLDAIVNAVAQAYLSRTAKRELDGTDVGFQLLTSRQTEIEQTIVTDQTQLAALTQELGVASVDGQLVNPYDKEIADTNSALARSRRNVVVAQAHLDAVKAHRERIKKADVEAKAQQDVAANASETAGAKQQLIQQREEAQFELSGLGPNHPGRKALEAQIATANEELAKLDQAALNRARSMLSDSEQAATSVDISEAESNLEQAQSSEKGIEKELDNVKGTATTFGAKYGQAVAIDEKLEHERKQLGDLQERMSMLRIKSQAPGVIALESAAMVPDAPQKSRRRLIVLLFALIGLAIGVGVPTAIDMTDRKIKTADEFEAILGFPPLGVMTGTNGTSHESLRRIALGIMREWRTSGIRSFVLTSVRDGANASLALALADELTELGVRSIAIEASLTGSNGRRRLKPPAPAPEAPTAPARGRASTRPTTRFAPQVAPTGALDARKQPAPHSSGDISVRSQNGIARTFGYVRETVDRTLANHDIILLAAPPLLSSADTIAIIQLPAGAILVARAGHDDVTEIGEAVRELERCAPPVVGAIMCSDDHRNGNGTRKFGQDLEVETSASHVSYGGAGH